MNDKNLVGRIVQLSIPAIIVFAVSWGIYTAKSDANALKIMDLEKKYETVLELKNDIGIIKNDIEYIKIAADRLIMIKK